MTMNQAATTVVENWSGSRRGTTNGCKVLVLILNMGITVHLSRLFVMFHSAVYMKSDKNKNENKEVERSSKPTYFLTPTQLANHCVRWVEMSDCWFRKVTETLLHYGCIMCGTCECVTVGLICTCWMCSRARGVAWVKTSMWMLWPGSSRIKQPMSNHLETTKGFWRCLLCICIYYYLH